MEMIVLYSETAVTDDPYIVPVSAHNPNEVSIAVQDLSSRNLVDMRRDPTVLAVAPPIPVQLIEALEAPAVPGLAPPATSWGVEAVGADASKFSGAGVTVAVLDTGIDQEHPAFKDRGVEINTANFTDEPETDINGHGTHCAEIIFGRSTNGCRIGVAPGIARALIGKVIGKGGSSTLAIYKAILWASQNGAHVISMSLGMDFPSYRERLAAVMPDKVATSMALVGYRANVRLFDRLSQITSARDGIVPGAVVVAAAGEREPPPGLPDRSRTARRRRAVPVGRGARAARNGRQEIVRGC